MHSERNDVVLKSPTLRRVKASKLQLRGTLLHLSVLWRYRPHIPIYESNITLTCFFITRRFQVYTVNMIYKSLYFSTLGAGVGYRTGTEMQQSILPNRLERSIGTQYG